MAEEGTERKREGRSLSVGEEVNRHIFFCLSHSRHSRCLISRSGRARRTRITISRSPVRLLTLRGWRSVSALKRNALNNRMWLRVTQVKLLIYNNAPYVAKPRKPHYFPSPPPLSLNNTSRLIEILLVNKLYKDGGASAECLISFCAQDSRAFRTVEENARNVSKYNIRYPLSTAAFRRERSLSPV